MDEPPREPDDDVTESQMGGAPRLLGGDRMRAEIAAALFGDDAPKEPTAGDADTLAAFDTSDGSYADLEESIVKDRLGRFRVLERLGRGGMGVVYSAYDPQLDRKVAVKLLRPDVHHGLGAEAATARLLREAQAMAKLNDPNVIAVHEVGMLDDRVFVAMEFVDGGTLGSWMTKPRRWREVLEVFLRAGAGLAAAHAADLVHRDFKPENVLLGTDGRVRVVDFGLARSVLDEEVAERRPRKREELPEQDSLNTPLTRTGAVMGTPAYMSPEQHLGRPADARSDQFSFCVALWEGLYGQRPFGGTSLAELTGNVLGAVVRDPPSGIAVPRWIVAAVRRGLSRNPDERFASMEALLAELHRDPRRKWRLGGLVGLGIGVVAFVGIGTYQRVLTGECDALVEQMDATWSTERRAAVVEAIKTPDLPWGTKVAESTSAALDSYVDDWRNRVQNACGASQVGSAEAKAMWKNKRLCFENRLAEVDQLIVQLTEGSPEMATTALQAAVALSDLRACEDPRRLAVWDELSDPKAQERLAHARQRLVRASTVGSLGQPQKAVETATAVIEDARELKVPALEGAGLFVRGLNRMRVDQSDPKVEEDLLLAVEHAKEGGDYATRAKALIQLGLVVSGEQSRFAEAFDIGERAKEALQSLESAPLLEANLDAMLGVAARRAGHWKEAIAYNRASLDKLRGLVGDSHPDTVRTLNGLGISLCRNGDYDEALAALRQAVTAYETVLGGTHPDLFTILQSLGVCLARQNRNEEALEVLTRALATYRQDPDADETRILTYEYNIAFTHFRSQNFTEALAAANKGLPRAKRLLAGRPKRLADWHNLLGGGLLGMGRAKEAVAAFQDALAVHRSAKAEASLIAGVELDIARATAQFDQARALILLEQLEGELTRAGDGAGMADVRQEHAALLTRVRAQDHAPPSSDGTPPTPAP